MSKNRVKISKWHEGALVHEEREYDYVFEALDYAKRIEHGIIKIYNELEELIHSWEVGDLHHDHECYA